MEKKIKQKVINEWRDIYKLPLHKAKYGSWVYDAESNFVFQFVSQFDDKGNYAEGWLDFEKNVLECLNGKRAIPNIICGHSDGNIYIKGQGEHKSTNIILIRGWGNLTGTRGHNLDGNIAAKIQDTFAEWIVSQLTVPQDQPKQNT